MHINMHIRSTCAMRACLRCSTQHATVDLCVSLCRVSVSFNEPAGKGAQMLSEGEKTRDASLAGYFAKEYIRAFEGDAYNDPVRLRRQARLLSKTKNLDKDWIPTQGIKMPSVSHHCTLLLFIAS